MISYYPLVVFLHLLWNAAFALTGNRIIYYYVYTSFHFCQVFTDPCWGKTFFWILYSNFSSLSYLLLFSLIHFFIFIFCSILFHSRLVYMIHFIFFSIFFLYSFYSILLPYFHVFFFHFHLIFIFILVTTPTTTQHNHKTTSTLK